MGIFFKSSAILVSVITYLVLVRSAPALAQEKEYATLQDLETVFQSVITWIAIIGGFLAFIALIIGGFKYIVARGDPKALSGAQSTITWALIGLALIIIAWLILVFIDEFTGVSVTEFIIKSPFPEP